MAVTLVSGVNGVGLSSVCQAVRRGLGDGYKLINFGDVMLEQAAAMGFTTERAKLGDLSQSQTRRLQRRAGEFVADEAAEADVLLSTHLAVETKTGYVQGLPSEVLHDVSPSAFVLVEASPETILDRRRTGDRDSHAVTERKISFEQDLNRSAALQYARDQNAPVRFIENEDSIEEAAERLADSL
ncbi:MULTISPECIES: adenylate kinase [unclassified Halorubrum]|uniref:adenylate kinase n=1 Tax=unclassified Halorubrum TaxID=2642239 RepID=UPI000B98DDF4|nr:MULTISPECIES: adenylate kinase [unclassified Halorubrum]OYR47553.1 adenylate kinase [Halorubrum sp. Eb13]OYR52106.1 adenylate kinase [Halorubrum sp. Ea1]